MPNLLDLYYDKLNEEVAVVMCIGKNGEFCLLSKRGRISYPTDDDFKEGRFEYLGHSEITIKELFNIKVKKDDKTVYDELVRLRETLERKLPDVFDVRKEENNAG